MNHIKNYINKLLKQLYLDGRIILKRPNNKIQSKGTNDKGIKHFTYL